MIKSKTCLCLEHLFDLDPCDLRPLGDRNYFLETFGPVADRRVDRQAN